MKGTKPLTLGGAIRMRRKELELQNTDLAEMAKVSVNTIYKIENDRANPALRVTERVCQTLRMRLVLQEE
jgi:DNA-binding XRE family transcriptional regulator